MTSIQSALTRSREPESILLATDDVEAPSCGRKGEPGILLQPAARQRDPLRGIRLEGRRFFV
jgi:hypothetical protein